MKPLNLIQIGKNILITKIKSFKCYQNCVARKNATLNKSRTQIFHGTAHPVSNSRT